MNLSVIIPCYNAGDTLGVQLESLAAQEVAVPWEVIVADNGSTDDTLSVAESFRDRLPGLRIVRAMATRGAAHARNCGAREARSRALAFCDADDEVAPGYVRAMIDALTRYPFVACRYDFQKLNRRWIARSHGSQTAGVDRGLLGPYAYAGGGSLGVRKEVHEAVGGFDETLSALEDTDYCVRLQRAGHHLHFAGEALVHVRWRSTVWQSFGQARRWGRSLVTVRARHVPAPPSPETAASLLLHLLRIRRVRSLDQLAQWIWATGWRVGSLEGQRLYGKKRIPSRQIQSTPSAL